MRFDFLGRVSRLAAIGAILLGSASCVNIDETLGESLIPTDQKWDVFTPEAVDLTDIRLQLSDSLSGYSSTRFTFGAINDEKLGTCMKSSSFTLVPVWDSLDFGRNTKVKQFHFSAVRDTLSTVYDKDQLILQNVYVSELKKPLDSTVIYMGSFADPKVLEEFVDLSSRITVGTPVYAGGDSLSFDFSLDFAERFVEKLKKADMDSVNAYINDIPGIYFYTDTPAGPGGRINMFELEIQTNSYHYLTGNYAELKFTAEYDHSDEPVDTSFTFLFGPSDFIKIDEDGNVTYPTQVAFNAGTHETSQIYAGEGIAATDKIYVEGGSGVKPVVKAEGIKRILDKMLADAGITDPSQVVINKATIMMPYDVEGDYDLLEKYPDVLSPTVRLRSTEGNYISYAGLTDSSIESENQGNINRSTFMYAPDISHHVQEILKLDRNDADYKKNIEKYDIWFLIMFEEVISEGTDNSSNSMMNNLLYNSYYNNMMYDPYGYGYGYGGYGGYGYGYGGYGYGSYGGYGYGSNYYNYMLMAQYASMGSGSSEEISVELDRDRFYNAVLNGPESDGARPQLKVTFSVPKSAE